MNPNNFLKTKKICLFLIVGNEAHCIERCLEGYIDLIDAIAITDTGSSDNTIEIIQEFGLKHDIATKVFESRWHQFDYNRNISIANAISWVREIEGLTKDGPITPEEYQTLSDIQWYFYTTDADDYIINCDFEELRKELDQNRMFKIKLERGNSKYDSFNTFRANISGTFCSEYICPVHEVLSPAAFATQVKALPILVKSTTEGNRSKSKVKYQKDSLLLEAVIREKRLAPGDIPRCIFYLAQSLRDCSYYAESILRYKQYLEIERYKTNQEYRYIALIRIADLYEFAYPDATQEQVEFYKLSHFLEAHNEQPYRREAMNFILDYFMKRDLHLIAWDLVKNYVIIENQEGLLVDQSYFNYYFDSKCMLCANRSGDMQNFMLFNERAIIKSETNPVDHQNFVNNRKYYPQEN